MNQSAERPEHVSSQDFASDFSDITFPEDRLHALAEATFDAVVLHNNGVVLDANTRFCELFGCRMSDIVGHAALAQFVAPESLQLVTDHLRSGDHHPCEAILQRLDGTRFVGEIRARTVVYGGRPVSVATARDISERKQSEARSQLFLELVTALSQTITQSGVARTIVHQAMRGVSGHLCVVGLLNPDAQTVELIEGAGNVAPPLEELRRLPLDAAHPIADTVRTGQSIWIETQDEYIRRYPGLTDLIVQTTHSHAAVCLPLQIQSQVVGAIGISFAEARRFDPSDRDFLIALAHQAALALDRARLYEAEQHARAVAEAAANRMSRLQTVISALSQAVTVQQVADVIVFHGIAALAAHAGSVAMLKDAHLEIISTANYSESTVASWRQIPLDADVPLAVCIRENQPVWICRRRDLNAAYPQIGQFAADNAHAWAALPLIVDGRPVGVLGLSFPSERTFDADERALLETLAGHSAQALERARLFEAEAKARAEAEEANALKIRFLGMISHELRTPLTSIKGFASTLLATDVHFDGATQQQYIQIIDTEANKLTALVEQLLDVSRLQAGTLPIKRAPHTLDDIIEIAAVQMRTLASEHPLDIQISKRLPPVMADAQRIAQVVVNLVDNAVKYSPAGEPIQLRTRTTNGFVEVKVSDGGAGIPRKDREFIFEAFQQLERKAGARRGAGLGLAICKGLIEAHGGRIWVQETRRRGTTIAFTLPVVDSDALQ